MTNLLRIDASARHEGSVSRELTTRLIDRLAADSTDQLDITVRDLEAGVPLLSESTLTAMWTPADDRTAAQRDRMHVVDEYVRELLDADVVVIGVPIYNFGPPASLKAWADLVAQAGTTFRYTDNGPVGLVDDKPVYVIVASGGVPVGSPMDFASTWLTSFLGFLGLRDVRVIEAGQLNVDPHRAVDAARDRVDGVELLAA